MTLIQKILIAVLILILLVVYLMNSIKVKISSVVLPSLNSTDSTLSLPIEITSLLPFSVPIQFKELKVLKSDGSLLVNSSATIDKPLQYLIKSGTNNLLIPFKIESFSLKSIPPAEWLLGVNLDIVGTIEVTVIFKFTINLKQRIKI